MIDAIMNVLMIRAGYTRRAAKVTAKQLFELKHKDLKKAVAEWLRSGTEQNVGEAPYDTESLMRNHKLKYPAAILFVDWYRTAPEIAVESISHWGGA